MTAKDELNQYKYMKEKVNETLEEYEKYKTRAEKMTSIISDSPSRTNKTSDKVGDNAVILADLEKEYEQRWIDAEYKKLEIEKNIERVEEPYRTILHKRYIEDKGFEEISCEMNYTYSAVTKMHGKALQLYSCKKMKDSAN